MLWGTQSKDLIEKIAYIFDDKKNALLRIKNVIYMKFSTVFYHFFHFLFVCFPPF